MKLVKIYKRNTECHCGLFEKVRNQQYRATNVYELHKLFCVLLTWKIVSKACLSSYHPFSSSLTENSHSAPWFQVQCSQAAPKMANSGINFFIV